MLTDGPVVVTGPVVDSVVVGGVSVGPVGPVVLTDGPVVLTEGPVVL